MKEKLFSITKKDFEVTFFRASGKGGQKRNKTASACRIKHKETGIMATCTDHREQSKNRAIAFKRLYDSKEFQAYMKIRIARETTDQSQLKREVEQELSDDNLIVETFKENKWIKTCI